ncbi:phospho-N-acetylmuramoyl-pentapeptide-transferase [Candidatus Dependentiae bacterium]|nr:phospho-N-acetylmuramoyl-pentapeptide-transferase [Candidatus Dependentiae bacterium]
MLYHLAQLLQPYYGFFNVFHYVSVRSICAFLSTLLVSFILGNKFITFSQKFFRSKAREWTPETHLIKNDTPTMGGLFMLSVFLINALLWANLINPSVWLFIWCVVSFGAIGFLDDYLKIKRHKGISSGFKFRLQLLASFLAVGGWYWLAHPPTNLCIPFIKSFAPALGLLIIPWGMFILIGTSNAVNLTDGLDGLATGPLIANFGSFALICYLAGHVKFASYLYIPYAGSAEIAILAAALVGALLGFLWYNTYPAQIFMGDVGSLPLGASLAFAALMARQEFLLAITGGIFVMETLSVMIQVTSYRLWGKRVFRMAPIHHHFELMGWKETKITVRFWIISIVLSVLALLTLKLR